MRNTTAWVSSLALMVSACGPSEEKATGDKNGIFKKVGGSAFGGACEHSGIATGDTVAVSANIDILDGPNGKKVVNEKASEVLKETHYQSVDQTEVLRELCRTKEWSKVQVIEPESLKNVVGWVPVSKLRAVEQTSDGARKYVADDFYWDKDTSPYKNELVAAANRIAVENANCGSIDPGTLAKSQTKSTSGKPVYFITCNGISDQPFNVWFERGDAKSGKSFAAIANIGRGDAVLACEQAAKNAANNPQTVNFSTFMDVAYIPYPNGRSRLLSSFTAKNAFGVEGKFTIGCLFEGSNLIETVVNEA